MCLLIIVCVIVVDVLCVLYTEYKKLEYTYYDTAWLAPVLGISIPVVIFLFALMLAQFTVVWRKYKGNYIIFYNAAIKGHLIINDEVQAIGGIFQNDFYGQLPDGTEVYVKITFFGSVKFALGSLNNNLITFM